MFKIAIDAGHGLKTAGKRLLKETLIESEVE